MLGVFLVSAVVHEYIFCFVLGFFYPVMLMLFLVFGGELGLCVPLEGEPSRGRRPGVLLLQIPDGWGRPHTLLGRGMKVGVGRNLGTGREAAGGILGDVREDFWLEWSI